MAIKYFCDRCGKLVGDYFGMDAVKIKKRCKVGSETWDDYEDYDLCADCIIQVKKFILEA